LIRDPYQAYIHNCVVGSSSVQLVVAMYETAIRRTQEAQACLESGDVWGRARAVSKAGKILTELIVSINPEVESDLGPNLDRLYRYMQRRLQEAHAEKKAEPLVEVEKLLRQLLEAWHKVAEAEACATSSREMQSEPGIGDTFSTYSPDALVAGACQPVCVSG
jgi:flagellar protein FliS